MRKYWTVILLGIALIYYACDDPSPVGIDFIGEDPLNVTYYDTISIKLSTIKFDSLATSNTSRLLVGVGKDDLLGQITAKPFFQVSRDSLNDFPDEENATYDSLALELIFDGYSYYDTAQNQTFSLYTIIDEMELRDDGNLYNTSQYEYLADSVFYLGEISFQPRVRKGKPAYLRINDTYGEALFDLLRLKDEIVEDDDDFLEYIKGFVLVPDSSNTCIIGLSNETNIKLFYAQEGVQTELEFPIANSIHFTQISKSYADSLLNSISSQKEILSSANLDDKAIIQGGSGLSIRLEIPYLDYVRELSSNNLVTDAELILSPVKNSYSGLNPLTADFVAYKVDKYNNIIRELSIDPVLYYDDEYNEDTFYSINIHAFLEEQLNLIENDGSAILISLPQSENIGSVNRILIGDENHESKSYLRLLVMNIKESF